MQGQDFYRQRKDFGLYHWECSEVLSTKLLFSKCSSDAFSGWKVKNQLKGLTRVHSGKQFRKLELQSKRGITVVELRWYGGEGGSRDQKEENGQRLDMRDEEEEDVTFGLHYSVCDGILYGNETLKGIS